VPIFILSRHAPPVEFAQMPLVTYLNDLETAMTRAREAAGEKHVLVHGAAITQRALAAGLTDHLGPEHIELERTRVLEWEGGVTHIHYRVTR
jgi:dihydrofolate reductase